MKAITRICGKELNGFFSTPIAYIVIAGFLGTVLFNFFWIETFFARNIADLRPLFTAMPVLLIFLTAAITMRMWSEERRSGTLEFLLTSPVSPAGLVIGKFFACLVLVIISLSLTVPLTIVIALISTVDPGPVIGAYLATLFLAAAYISIGLFVSVRSDNQIVSLIVSTLICAALYLLGSEFITDLLGNRGAEWLSLLATGTRFESITRGVLDLRDLFYYVSLTGAFLCLNIYSLERMRWADNRGSENHRQWGLLTGLACLNLLFLNLPLHGVEGARADMTRGHIYSLSPATKNYLASLREPLLIRGYFSAKTHPLLAPLVPRIRDLLKEYEVAGRGSVRVELVDPHQDQDIEREAGEKYGIRPVPFQTASKYQAAVVNSYFDILIKYGDQYETLGFRDLIDIKAQDETDVQVDLRNPEYDITRSIKKVLQNYQGSGQLFSNLPTIHFTGYLTPDKALPETLRKIHQELDSALKEIKQKAGEKLIIRYIDPEAGDGSTAKMLRDNYGLRPMTTSILDQRRFWFYMLLEGNGRIIQIPLPEQLDSGSIKRGLEAAMKRFSRGFLKTIAIYQPETVPDMSRFGVPSKGGMHYSLLKDQLNQNYDVVATDLKSGHIPDQADFLIILDPKGLDKRQIFAIDQFLMRGGSILLAATPFEIDLRGRLSASTKPTGLEEWLRQIGIETPKEMVLDPQNSAFPIPVQRNLGGFIINEAQLVDYPYFVDLSKVGINQTNGLMTGIERLTINWAAPIQVNLEKIKGRSLTRLLTSSAQSWTSGNTNIQPDFDRFGPLGFPVTGDRKPRDLAVMIEGRFDSFFKGKPSPLLQAAGDKVSDSANGQDNSKDKPEAPLFNRVLERSPDSGRVILISSSTFMSDEIIDLVSSTLGTRYRTPVQMIQNAVDWSLEDRGLLAIRGRAQFAHTLPAMERSQQQFWENLIYFLTLGGLIIVWLLYRFRHRQTELKYSSWIAIHSGHKQTEGGT